jgi:hypothetical protein
LNWCRMDSFLTLFGFFLFHFSSQTVLCECNAMPQEEWLLQLDLWKRVRCLPTAPCICWFELLPSSVAFYIFLLKLPIFQVETRASSACSKLADAFQRSRMLLREVGVAASVPIEPEKQSVLINATMQVL